MMIQTPQKRPYSVADHQIQVLYINIARIVLNCQRCKECLNVHKSLGLLFETVLQILWHCLCNCHCLFVGQVMSPPHSDHMAQETQEIHFQFLQLQIFQCKCLRHKLSIHNHCELSCSSQKILRWLIRKYPLWASLRTFAVDSYFLYNR